MYSAAQVDRTTSDWSITLTSANAEILVSAIATRSRLRQLERDDDYFRRMLDLVEAGTVGWRGVRLRSTLDEKRRSVLLSTWERALSAKNCNVNRRMHGVALQRLAMRSLARDGGMVFRTYPGYANEFHFAIRDYEIDHLDHYWNQPRMTGSGTTTLFSIEMDQFNAPVAYHLLHQHPGEVFAYRSGPRYRDRVPADEIIPFLNSFERSGQATGMPLWPSVGNRLNHLRNYDKNELIASRVASAKGGWFEKTTMTGEYSGDGKDSNGNTLVDTSPGQWEELPMGWKAVQNDPTHPVDAYAAFIKGQLRGASAGANLPYNSVANDLEGVNYSSIRAGLLEARDTFKYLQYRLAAELMQPWFEAWLPFAILSRQLPFEMGDIPEILASVTWLGRRWDWVDPLKDTQASVMALNNKLTSHRRIIEESEEDGDIEDVFHEIEQDEAMAKQHKFTLTEPTPAKGNVDKPGISDE